MSVFARFLPVPSKSVVVETRGSPVYCRYYPHVNLKMDLEMEIDQSALILCAGGSSEVAQSGGERNFEKKEGIHIRCSLIKYLFRREKEAQKTH